ncbi:MAG: beta-propeller domain-containing protein [Acidimicrobiia bacterium]
MRTRTVRRGIRTVAALAAVTLAATACTDEVGAPPSTGGIFATGESAAAPLLLQADRSCDAVLEDMQAYSTSVLSDQLFGFGGDMDVAMEGADVAAPVARGEAMAAADSAGGATAGGTSSTNTQEAGIDEPDVVETDGDHVYLVDQEELVVLDGATGAVLSRTRLASWGGQLLLQGDRLLVVAGGMGYGMPMPVEGDGSIGGPAPVDPVLVYPVLVDPAVEPERRPIEPGSTEPAPAPEPEPELEPEPAPEPQPAPVPQPEPEPQPVPEPAPIPIEPPAFPAGTVLQLLDVSDPAAPQVVQTTELEGTHVTTRVVDGVARVVIASWPQPEPVLEGLSFEGDVSTSSGAAAAREAVAERVADTEIGDWLPSFRTTVLEEEAPTSDEGEIVACEDVLVPEVNAGVAQTSILRVDFADGFDPADTTTVVAEAGTVYASAERLYLAANRWVPATDDPAADAAASTDTTTALHVFDLGGEGAAPHVAAGEVPGHVLNQYSLSEHDGHLRIATTEGDPWAGEGVEPSSSSVRVLRLDGDRLVEVGVVTGLGLTETIQSVRFMGPVGYVVTFRQTDPLYVIDLSDPTSPEAVGELKIPGFSSYLHPAGDGRLVGIGRDATLEGVDQGLLVSLFDVSDPTDPRQLQTWTERDAWSQAGADPKAFLHWAPESAVVVPIERYGTFDETGRELTPTRMGMVVLDIADGGITERATVSVDGRFPSRALVVQDRLWSLFDGGVVVSDFDDPAAGTFTPYR